MHNLEVWSHSIENWQDFKIIIMFHEMEKLFCTWITEIHHFTICSLQLLLKEGHNKQLFGQDSYILG